jgi:hypothetical protein
VFIRVRTEGTLRAKILLQTADNNKVFSKELTELLKQVIMSWEVIAVTVALVIYIYLVTYAARRYHRPRMKSEKPNKRKSKSDAPAGPVATEAGSDTNDELGLEEA